MQRQTQLDLPYPPSVNHYWRYAKGRSQPYIDGKGLAYIEEVKIAVYHQSGPRKPLTGRLKLAIDWHPPDGRRRDIDNVLKVLLDAATKAGVWVDDSQIDALMITRRAAARGGLMRMTIDEFPDPQGSLFPGAEGSE